MHSLLRQHAISSALFLTACLAACAVYFAGLSGDFMFDDGPSITKNSALSLFDGSPRSLIAASSDGVASALGRPLAMASFAINLHFFGPHPFSFKLVNLIIHLANGLLVMLLARRLWPLLTGSKKSLLPGAWISTVWLLHPINLTPVLFVVQRMTSLSAFFMLGALCLYTYGRQKQGYRMWLAIGASLLLCWSAAILSKETGALLPLYLFLTEWLAFRSLRSLPARTKLIGILAIGALTAAILALKWDYLTAGYGIRDFALAERLMTQARVLWFYAAQLIFPWPDLFALHHDDIAISRGLFAPASTLAAIGAGALVLVVAAVRRKRSPLVLFAIAWFIVSHLLESTILPLEIAYEHRNYLASFGILIWAASKLFPAHDPSSGRIPRQVFALAFLAWCAMITALRSDQWADEFQRTQIEAAVHPNSARANYEAAMAIITHAPGVKDANTPIHQIARFHFKRAAELNRNGKHALIGSMYLDCLARVPRDDKLQAELRRRFATAPLPFGDRGMVQSLSALLVEQRLCLRDDEVKTLLDAALSNPTADGSMRGLIYAVAMDHAFARIGSLPLALEYARAGVASDPHSAVPRINLIELLLRAGDKQEARRQYTELAGIRIAAQRRAEVHELGLKLKSME